MYTNRVVVYREWQLENVESEYPLSFLRYERLSVFAFPLERWACAIVWTIFLLHFLSFQFSDWYFVVAVSDIVICGKRSTAPTFWNCTKMKINVNRKQPLLWTFAPKLFRWFSIEQFKFTWITEYYRFSFSESKTWKILFWASHDSRTQIVYPGHRQWGRFTRLALEITIGSAAK